MLPFLLRLSIDFHNVNIDNVNIHHADVETVGWNSFRLSRRSDMVAAVDPLEGKAGDMVLAP